MVDDVTEQESPEKLSPRERAFRLLDQLRNERRVTMAIFGLMVSFVVGVQIMLAMTTFGSEAAAPEAVEETALNDVAGEVVAP